MSPAKRRKILKVVARLLPSGLGSAALPAALADRWAVGGGLCERGISSVRQSVRPWMSQSSKKPALDFTPAATALTAATAEWPRQVTPTNTSSCWPPTSTAAGAQRACAAGPGPQSCGGGAPRGPQARETPTYPARVHRRLSEGLTPLLEGTLAGGLRHHAHLCPEPSRA